jgi:hypothetical protein
MLSVFTTNIIYHYKLQVVNLQIYKKQTLDVCDMVHVLLTSFHITTNNNG